MAQYSCITWLQSHATIPRRAAAQRNAAPAPLATQPLGYSPPRHQREYSVLRHLRKLLPSSLRMDDIRTVEPHDPLDVCIFILFLL